VTETSVDARTGDEPEAEVCWNPDSPLSVTSRNSATDDGKVCGGHRVCHCLVGYDANYSVSEKPVLSVFRVDTVLP
jgi:hypothetical protein